MAAAAADCVPLGDLDVSRGGGWAIPSHAPGVTPPSGILSANGDDNDVLGRILGLSEPSREAEEMATYLQHAFTDRADQVGEPGANPFLLEEENLDTDTFAYARSELSDGSSPGATIEDALLEELLRSSEEGGDTAASPPCAPSSPARGAVPKDKDAGGRAAAAAREALNLQTYTARRRRERRVSSKCSLVVSPSSPRSIRVVAPMPSCAARSAPAPA